MKVNLLTVVKNPFITGIKAVRGSIHPENLRYLPEKTDTFCRQSYIDKIKNLKSSDYNIGTIWHARCKITDINPESYKTLTPEELNSLRSSILPQTAVKVENIVNITKSLKKYFDNEYGDGKYSFVSIGRSLATVSKCMEFLGAESKRIPFSGCNNKSESIVIGGIVNPIIINNIVGQKGFDKYKNYLMEVLNNDKINLLSDYCATGATLNTFKEIVSHPCIGLKSQSNIFININKLLKKLGNDSLIDKKEIKFFLNNLNQQTFDEWAVIDSLHYKSLGNIHQSLKPRHPQKSDFLNFIMLDMLKG